MSSGCMVMVMRLTAGPRLILLCGSGPRDSAVEVLAERLALATHLPTEMLTIDDGGSPLTYSERSRRSLLTYHLDALSRSRDDGAVLVALGLPSDTALAQAVVNEIVSRGTRGALLWERAGHSTADLTVGLDMVAALSTVLTLAEVHRKTIASFAPNARILQLSAAIPRIFFNHAELERQRSEPFAVFIGRSHPSKGGQRLARAWADRVYPRTSVPLRMYLVDHEAAQAQGWGGGGVTLSRLAGADERATIMRAATVVLFPARHDHLPQALLESSASGALIAATEIPGHAIDRSGFSGLRLDNNLTNLEAVVRWALVDTPALDRRRVEASRMCARLHLPEAAGRTLAGLAGV